MSFGYTNSAKKIKVGNPVAKAILLLLADMASDDGFCFPSEKTIADTLELGESTVRKHLQTLDGKFLTKTKMSGDKWKHNGYQLSFAPDFAEKESESSPLPDVADNPSPLPRSGENGISPLPQRIITATTYHRYDVATKHKNKDLFLEPSEESEEREEKNARPREIPNPVILSPETDQTEYEIFSDGMKARLGTPKQLPKKDVWDKLFAFWTGNGYSADNLLETFDLLEEIKQQREAPWMVTAKTVEGFIGKIESLRLESENLMNGVTINGSTQQNLATANDRRLKDTRETDEYIAALLAASLAEQGLQSEFNGIA